MKLTLIFLLICNACVGQTKGTLLNDSLLKVMKDSGKSLMYLGGFTSGFTTGLIFDTIKRVTIKDTVLVEAIVTDTFYRPHAPSYSLTVYVIRKREDMPDCSGCWPTYYVVGYLDEKKNPLPKDIIVWQSFGIKK